MGRTSRKRRQKKKNNVSKLKIDDITIFNQLKAWMLSKRWLPICDLIPYNFPTTGRGLMTLRHIKSSETLMKLPKDLLITTSVVSQSYIRIVFLNSKSYKAQCVLAIFLIYEMHLENSSMWKSYIDTLPKLYTNPDFCSTKEKKSLPLCVLNYLNGQSEILKDGYRLVMNSIGTLRRSGKNICPHCNVPLDELLTFSKYKWAYYTVNTRAVYIDNTRNRNKDINIEDIDNLALVPFLDLFNHTFDTSVRTCVVSTDDQKEFYQIDTLKSFKQGSQVFINYGSHNNLRLYAEYGFYIPGNPLDEVFFNLDDIKKCLVFPESTYDFIKSHSFDRDMGFTSEGLNYHAKITLFVLSTKLEYKHWKMKIYSEEFNYEDLINLNCLGKEVLILKRTELECDLKKMRQIVGGSSSFCIAMRLVEEYIYILERSFINLTAAVAACN